MSCILLLLRCYPITWYVPVDRIVPLLIRLLSCYIHLLVLVVYCTAFQLLRCPPSTYILTPFLSPDFLRRSYAPFKALFLFHAALSRNLCFHLSFEYMFSTIIFLLIDYLGAEIL